MPQSLQIFANSDPTQPPDRVSNVQSHHANNLSFVQKHERMIAGPGIVRMILDVTLTLAAILEKHPPANRVKRTQLRIADRSSQFMFELNKLKRHVETSETNPH